MAGYNSYPGYFPSSSGSSPGTITAAQNGLSKPDASTVELGGSLLHTTTIDLSSSTLQFANSPNGQSFKWINFVGNGHETFYVNYLSANAYSSLSADGDEGIFFNNPNSFIIAPWVTGQMYGIKLNSTGQIGIRVLSPSAKLHIEGGNDTVNNAPIKIGAGTLQTVPEKGAIEYTTAGFYATNNNSTRRRFGFVSNQIYSISSASAVTLNTDGNVFSITGTTTINYLNTVSWDDGQEVVLIFTASLTVTNNAGSPGVNEASFLLAGGINFSATANDVLTLIYTRFNWTEKSRSIN